MPTGKHTVTVKPAIALCNVELEIHKLLAGDTYPFPPMKMKISKMKISNPFQVMMMIRNKTAYLELRMKLDQSTSIMHYELSS